MTANEAGCMNELDPRDPRDFFQFLVAEAKPHLMQELATDERALLDWNALDAVVFRAAIEEHVLNFNFFQISFDFAQMFLPWTEASKLNDLTRWVDTEAILNGLLDELASWQPGSAEVLDFVLEFFANLILSLQEELENFSIGFILSPVWVEGLDTI